MQTTNPSQDLSKLWESSLAEIELSVSKPNFTTWFKNTQIVKDDGGLIYLGVPNGFVKEWLHNKYHKFILKSLRDLRGDIRGIEYVVAPKDDNKRAPGAPQWQAEEAVMGELPLKDLYINKDDNLNPKYTFDSFVVGPFNELSHAAAQAVIKNPGVAYNPLFIHGSTGLGKTHLIQAIGNEIKKIGMDKRVYYLTSEKFYLDYVNSVQANRISIFKEKYRKFDVLIMDDVQFFSGKQATQDEFFHLFNAFHDNNKQIVFSSDRHYNYIPEIEDRLRTRLGAGTIVDIGEPDFETRIAILKLKLKNHTFSPSDKILELIARTVAGSIREMEGTLNSIICQSQLKNRDLTTEEASALIKNKERIKKAITTEDVIKMVSSFYDIDREVICQKTRKKEVVKPRQMIMYILREDFKISYPTIGQKLGGRDHTTVIHSCEKIKSDLKKNNSLTQELEQIRALF